MEVHISFEGVPYNWLTSANRQLPITLDYHTRTGSANGNEAWQSGITYFVSGDYTVPSARTLAIEGGAIVKIDGTRKIIIANGGKLLAKGSKFDYIFITKAADGTIGETVSASGGDGYGFEFASTASPDTNASEIKYCKFRYQNCAIKFLGNIALAPQPEDPPRIAHCIFSSCLASIRFFGSGVNPQVKILNCLFTGSGYDAIYAIMNGNLTFEMRNCTVNNYCVGFTYQTSTGLVLVLKAYDNLFTSTQCAFSGSGSAQIGGCIDYCAFWETVPKSSPSPYDGIYGDHNLEDEDLPPTIYVSSLNGSFYTAEFYFDREILVTDALHDKGEPWASYLYDDEMHTRTIIRPQQLNNDNINDTPAPSERYLFDHTGPDTYYTFGDAGTAVDIGYHYDIVHGVIENTQGSAVSLNTTMTINPQKIISYYGQSTQLNVTSSGCLEAKGTTDGPILFTSTHMTDDGFSMPSNYHYERAIHLEYTASRDTRIEFCEFNRSYVAVTIESAGAEPFQLNHPIANCVFKENYYGISAVNLANRIDILNNLFIANQIDAVRVRYYIEFGGNKSFLNLEGNTFTQNNNGLYLINSTADAELRVVVEDNIFSSNGIAVATAPGFDSARVYDVTRNNIFWNNGTNIQNSALDVSDPTNMININPPLMVHHTCASSGETVVDYDLPGGDDGYYLSQCPGDSPLLPGDGSRRAFRLGNLHSTQGISDVSGFTGLVFRIYVGVSEGIPSDSSILNNSMRKGAYEVNEDEEFYIPGGDQQGQGPTWIAIIPEEKSYVQLGANPHFRLTTTNGTVLDVYLPPNLTIASTYGLALFLAEDGSTFWGNSSHTTAGLHYFNQDAYYSLRWDVTSPGGRYQPARSAYDAAGASPAVDTGSRDFLNSGYTSTDVGNITLPEDQSNPNRDNPNTSQTTDDSLYTRLDIGYHYFGSLRHPRERIPAIRVVTEFGEVYPTFRVDEAHQVAVASGPYNTDPETDFPDTTIATFRGEYARPDGYYAFFLFHQFRSQNNNGMIDDPYEPFGIYRGAYIDRIAMTASTENDNPAGVIYAACTVNWYDIEDPDRPRGQAQLDVYRYNGDGTWTRIGRYQAAGEPPPACLEVALAVRNQGPRQDLWVFWIEGDIGFSGSIYGARIENAAARNTDGLGMGVALRDLSIITGGPEQGLDADWDRNWYQHYPYGNPRIIWGEKDQNDRWNIRESWIRLWDTGDPRDLQSIQYVADADSYQYMYPSLSVNQRFSINQQRAFAAFERSDDRIRTNTMDMGGTWGEQPEEFSAPTEVEYRFWPDVASRFFETRRICFGLGQGNHQLFTNTECVNPDGPTIDAEFPRIATNGANLIDQLLVFASQWTQSDDSTIDLFHIDP